MSLAVNGENGGRTVVLYMTAHASAVGISFPLRKMVMLFPLYAMPSPVGDIDDVRLLSHM